MVVYSELEYNKNNPQAELLLALALRAIAAGLNEQGIPTARRQGTWFAVQVARVPERI
jgi:hypothetical protein